MFSVLIPVPQSEKAKAQPHVIGPMPEEATTYVRSSFVGEPTNFGLAFSAARKAGWPRFYWHGTTYTTRRADDA